MQPTTSQLEQLQSAMLKAFNHAELSRLVRTQLDLDLEWITPVAGKRDLTTIVYDLVAFFASQEGGLNQLLQAATDSNSISPELQAVIADWDNVDFSPIELPTTHPHQTTINQQIVYGDEVHGSKVEGDLVKGNKIEYHMHTGGTSTNVQLRATAVLAEVAAMTFVDLMRLMGCRSHSVVFQRNVSRYDEFVDTATEHLDDLKGQLERFSSSLSDEQFTKITKVERQIKWMLARIRAKPSEPSIQPEFFRRMRDLSDDVHNFCQSSGHARYTADNVIVKSVTDAIRPTLEAEDTSNSGVYWGARMYLQTQALIEREPEAKELYGIWFDPNYELAFTYFGIDYFLLAEIVENCI